MSCADCKYAKTSGEYYICDFGIREQESRWGNTKHFACIKFTEKEDDAAKRQVIVRYRNDSWNY